MKSTLSNNSLLLRAYLVLMILPGSTLAATDGMPGDFTVGSLDVNLTIPEIIQFRVSFELDDAIRSEKGDIIRQSDACIFFNGNPHYSITVKTNRNSFNLTSQRGSEKKKIEFEAYWNDNSGMKGRHKLEHNTPLRGQILDQSTSQKCLNGEITGNSNFSIQIPRKNIQPMSKGTYSTMISIIIAPE